MPIKFMGNKIGMIKIIWLEQEDKHSTKKDNNNNTNNTKMNLQKNKIMLITRQHRDIQQVSFFKKGGYAATHYRGHH